MNEHSFIQNRLALLPDSELLELINDVLSATASSDKRSMKRDERVRLARQVEAISREIRARGMNNPPWWSADREWEIEDRPIGARSLVGDVMFTT